MIIFNNCLQKRKLIFITIAKMYTCNNYLCLALSLPKFSIQFSYHSIDIEKFQVHLLIAYKLNTSSVVRLFVQIIYDSIQFNLLKPSIKFSIKQKLFLCLYLPSTNRLQYSEHNHRFLERLKTCHHYLARLWSLCLLNTTLSSLITP